LQESGLPAQIQASLNDMKSPGAREGALVAFIAICETVGQPAEPFLTPFLALVLERYSDKIASIRVAAAAAGKAFTDILCPTSIRVILPILLQGLDAKNNWQTKTGSLAVIDALAKKFPKVIAYCLPEMVPVISFTLSDAKAAVKVRATPSRPRLPEPAVYAMQLLCKASERSVLCGTACACRLVTHAKLQHNTLSMCSLSTLPCCRRPLPSPP
jgi:hypothetical protein